MGQGCSGLVHGDNDGQLGLATALPVPVRLGSPSRIRTRVRELLRGLSADALGDLERGRDALARSLLATLAGVGR